MTLDEALDKWQVAEPGMWENDKGPVGWYAVMDDDGIVAYFANGADAYRWRMSMVNRDINP